MTTRLRRRALDVLLVLTGLVLAASVVSDIAQRVDLAQRMRVDRHALRVYLQPQPVDPNLMTIAVHGSRDLVCVPTKAKRRHKRSHDGRVCVHVLHANGSVARVVVAPGPRPPRAARHRGAGKAEYAAMVQRRES